MKNSFYKYIRTQVGLFAILINNWIYNLIPFFALKRFYLQLTNVKISSTSYIHTKVNFLWIGRISIGSNCTINPRCLLDARYGIEIGDNVMVGHDSKIYTAGHDVDDEFFCNSGGAVKIENDVVIFTSVIILPNVKIGQGAVVYPGSVVTKNVEPYNIVGGNPAKFIRMRSAKINYKLNHSHWFVNS
jgi:acetyltransferase-like isoleucine patch superfamily enzyme